MRMCRQIRKFGVMVLTGVLILSCDEDVPSEEIEEGIAIDVPVPLGSSATVSKDFRIIQGSGFFRYLPTASIGYDTEEPGCGSSGMLSATEEFDIEEVYFNSNHGDTTLFHYHDAAVNTTCADFGAAGYLIFDRRGSRGGSADPYLELTSREGDGKPYISVLQFSLAGIDASGGGLSVYVSSGGGAYELLSEFAAGASPAFYSVLIDASDVKLRLAPAESETGYICLTELRLYGRGVPAGSVLYVDELFRGWQIRGYEEPYPDPINKSGTNLVPLVKSGSVEDYAVTGTYEAGIPVTITVHNGANYPFGYNHHGDTALVLGLSTGYVELPNKDNEDNEIQSSLTVSAVPSVSLLEFWIAVTGPSGQYQVWKSVGGGEYMLYADIALGMPAGIGKYFRYHINERDVSIRFTPKAGFTSTVPKVYGVRIWSDGKP